MLSLPEGSALYRVFGPGLAVRGMFSARERSLLGPGEFQLLQNMRCDEGLPRVRKGLSFVMNPPSFAVGPPLGSTSCSLNGTRWVVAVWSDGSMGRVCVMPPSLDRWVEVTSTNAWTGPLGNNRLTNITNAVSFTVIKTPRYDSGSSIYASRDVLLIQNGEDYPRMFDPDTEYRASPLTITGATKTSPIEVTISGVHNLSPSGDHIYISGATGMTEMNGLWQIVKTNINKFTLTGSSGVNTYTGGGTAQDRIDLLVHKPIRVPSTIGYSYATFEAYLQVAGLSGKTYVTGVPSVNVSGRYEFKQTTASPYTDDNTCILWNIGLSAVANDKATVQFASGILIGKQLVMLWEGAGASTIIKQCRIEINTDNTGYVTIGQPWKTIYDPSSMDSILNKDPIIITESVSNNRNWFVWNTSHIDTATAFHLRFTRLINGLSAAQTATLIFCGSTEGDFFGDTTFGMSYEDNVNHSESSTHLMSALSDSVGILGGATIVKDGSSTTASPKLPLGHQLLTSFRIEFSNPSDMQQIFGGLDGTPPRLNVYARRSGSTNHYFVNYYSLQDYAYSGATRSWVNPSYQQPLLSPNPITYTQNLINYNREAPSEFQQPIPIASACTYANGRLFAGGVKDTAGQYGNGDVYFSWQRNPFRFQQIQEDDFRGGYLQVSGEKVQSFISGASSSLNSGKVYMLTDQSIYSLGDSGPLAGGSFAASDISRPVKMGPHGAISARTVAQGYNSVFWVDQDSQLMRLANGEIVNIGKYQVHDKLESVPTNLTKNLAGVFRNDRYYLGLAKTGSSSNDTVLIWNERLQGFESLDVPSKSFEQPFLHGPSATTIGTRTFFFHTDGKLYAYEENATDDAGTPIIARFTTGSIVSSEWEGFFVNECQAMVTSSPGGSLTVNRVSRRWGAAEPWATTLSVDKTGAAVAIYRDSFAHTKTGANRGLETDWDWYLDVSGSLPPSSQFIRFECALQPTSVALGER